MQNTPVLDSRPTSLGVGALLGILSSIALIGLFLMGEKLFGFPFVPFDDDFESPAAVVFDFGLSSPPPVKAK